jgi:hypothetical protein
VSSAFLEIVRRDFASEERVSIQELVTKSSPLEEEASLSERGHETP